MDSKNTISIITTSYNSENTIEETLKSVKKQKEFLDFEYIVIDGKSTDNTLGIIKKYMNIIDVVISEPDNGIYDALNKGIKVSTGNIIGFIHSDDIYAKEDLLLLIHNKFNSDINIDAIYGDINYINKQGKTVRKWRDSKFKFYKLLFGWMPAHPSLFLKKSIYNKYGIFNTNYKISADYDFILRIFSKGDLNAIHLPYCFINMTIGGHSNGSFKGILRKSFEDFSIILKSKFFIITPFTLLFKNLSKLKQIRF